MARIAVILLLVLGASALYAHPFDDRCDMVAEVILLKDAANNKEYLQLQVQYRYETPYASYNEAYLQLDTNRDGKVVRSELTKRFETLANDLTESGVLKVRDEPAVLKARFDKFAFANLDDPDASVDGPNGMPVEKLRIGYFFYFDVEFATSWGPGTHPVEFYLPNRRIMITDPAAQLRAWDDRGAERRAVTSVYYDRTEDRFDRLRFVWDVQEGFSTRATNINPNDKPPDKTDTPPDKTDTTQSAGNPEGKQQLFETDKERRSEAWFDRWVREAYEGLKDPNAGLGVWLTFMGLMLILGGYHAVQPGHGKTLVASYLIGTHGTKTDALFLGVVVTAAHTSGVLLLMGGAWIASEFWPDVMDDPRKSLAEWIALAVGATIFLMGVGLVFKRTGGGHHEHDIFGRHIDGHSHDHDHDHSHDHSHDHGHEHAPVAVAKDEKGPEDSDILEEVVEHSHDHDHSHDHGHSHDHDHSHDHGHSHSHGHHHHHGEELDPSKMTRWEILRLGILGGIVPCPSAFVIGLIFFSAKLYFAGLVMVVVFSFGLAIVLATIGLMLVHSKEYLNRKRKETRSKLYRLLEAKLPVFGALVITLIGTVMVLMAMIRLELIDPAKFTV
ncbi:MAG: sulfite exporter TauE/SafE family protein [Planctomycetes bacterium]|nr:sulfite exporter TauE/SafE family protein [Planctomycetota bacterium]